MLTLSKTKHRYLNGNGQLEFSAKKLMLTYVVVLMSICSDARFGFNKKHVPVMRPLSVILVKAGCCASSGNANPISGASVANGS